MFRLFVALKTRTNDFKTMDSGHQANFGRNGVFSQFGFCNVAGRSLFRLIVALKVAHKQVLNYGFRPPSEFWKNDVFSKIGFCIMSGQEGSNLVPLWTYDGPSRV